MTVHEVHTKLDGRRLERSIGTRVKQRREQLRLAAKDVARLAGISRPMLSRIERGLISPSIGTLEALAQALRLPIGSLFRDFDGGQRAIVTRAGEGSLEIPKGMLLNTGGHGRNRMESYLFSAQSGNEQVCPPQCMGTAFLFVLGGWLKYLHHGIEYELKAGDSLFFDPSRDHRTLEIFADPTTFLFILCRSLLT